MKILVTPILCHQLEVSMLLISNVKMYILPIESAYDKETYELTNKNVRNKEIIEVIGSKYGAKINGLFFFFF